MFPRNRHEIDTKTRLFLDVGNSRLKWARIRGRRLLAAGAFSYAPVQRFASGLRRLRREARACDGTFVSSVAGRRIDRAIRDALGRSGRARPRFVRVARRAGGVVNAYAEPWRLGVDRWVALIGARSRYPDRALCIVSVGTALTLDLLDAGGRHCGGAIAPGPDLMVRSLLEGTAGIRRRARGGARAGRSLYARSTRAAIEAGARHAGAALIERALDEGSRRLGRRPLLLLAGGGAAALAPLLHVPWRRDDQLVMRGLRVLAGINTGT
ncbi:MAG: type III pantothenate kinase [Gammaproteobacteria bacterium]|nr:type III pantothenate kinase [Gammaproteobacteria bacterium]